jgi:hypothetical protein
METVTSQTVAPIGAIAMKSIREVVRYMDYVAMSDNYERYAKRVKANAESLRILAKLKDLDLTLFEEVVWSRCDIRLPEKQYQTLKQLVKAGYRCLYVCPYKGLQFFALEAPYNKKCLSVQGTHTVHFGFDKDGNVAKLGMPPIEGAKRPITIDINVLF